jgi:hypothetical protein
MNSWVFENSTPIVMAGKAIFIKELTLTSYRFKPAIA